MANKKNHRSADAVADYFQVQVSMESEYIGTLKMQKLCYLAQGWSLALRGKALFDDAFEAWALGPLIPSLYRRFRRHRWHPIPFRLKSDPLKELDAEEVALLDWVWKAYGHSTAGELKRLTRAQAPWKEAYGNNEPLDPCHEEITQKSMRAYFLTQKPPLPWGAQRAKAA